LTILQHVIITGVAVVATGIAFSAHKD